MSLEGFTDAGAKVSGAKSPYAKNVSYANDIGKILKSKAGADCTMKTSCGKVFDVHRCILAGKERNEDS
jgi:hypothetical protein